MATPESTPPDFTSHAVHVMAERRIPVDWVTRVLAEPTWRTPDPNGPEIERFFGLIPERDNRMLRVAVNTRVVPWRVVSVFFDRNMRGQV